MAGNHKRGLYIGSSRLTQWMNAAICVLALAAFFLPLWIGWGPLDMMAFLYLGLCLILFFPLRSLYRSLNYLCLFQEGIEIHRLFSHTSFLNWEDISQIRGSVWSTDLIVSNERGDVSFRVSSEFDNAPELLEWIIFFRPDLFRFATPLSLSMSPIPGILFGGFVLEFSVLILYNGAFADQNGIILLSILLFCLLCITALFATMPYSITIVGAQLVLRTLFRTTVLPATDVSHFTSTSRMIYMFELGDVTIRHRRGKHVVLMFYYLGIPLLYAFLSAWHRVATTPLLESHGLSMNPAGQGSGPAVRQLPYGLPARDQG